MNWNASQSREPVRTCPECGDRFRQDEPGLCPTCGIKMALRERPAIPPAIPMVRKERLHAGGAQARDWLSAAILALIVFALLFGVHDLLTIAAGRATHVHPEGP